MLTRHGLFRSYLHKMGKVWDPQCLSCGDPKDDALHTFFKCERWAQDRHDLESALGQISPDSTIGVMLQGEKNWTKPANRRTEARRRGRGCQ